MRKRFAHNPYTLTNVMNVCECVPLDVQYYEKYNDNYRYILSLIDVFSKFLYMTLIKSESGTSVVSAFRNLIDDPKYSKSRRCLLRVGNDRGKQFLNRHFQGKLRDECGIKFQGCRYHELK